MFRLARALLALSLLSAFGCAFAQRYPSRPIRWVIPSSPGSAYDVIARALSPLMAEDLGQPVVIENRAGATGIVGLEFVKNSEPDGYTVVAGGVSQMVMNPLFQPKIPYDTQKDFTPIGLVGDLVMALYVHSSIPANTLKEFIAYTKAHPGKVYYGSSGIGQSFHLAGEMLKLRTGADLTHVPYKGTTPALQDFFTGRIQMMFYPPSSAVLQQIKAGAIRPLAAMSDKRLPALPDVPTFEEAGVQNLGVTGWGGMAGPAGMPRDVVLRLNGALNKASARPEMVKAYEAMTMQPVRSTPEEMAERIRHDTEFWRDMMKKIGLKPEG